MRRTALLSVLIVAACAGAAAPPGGVPAASGGRAASGASPGASASAAQEPAPTPEQSFARLRDQILEDWLHDEPSHAREVGLHDADGRVADYSKAALAARNQKLKTQLGALDALDAAKLSPDDALDHALLRQQLEQTTFEYEERALWRKNPAFYGELFGVETYITKSYAPLELRAKKLLEHEQAALPQVRYIAENLERPLSRPVIETAIKIYAGYAEYLRGDVVKLVSPVTDPAFHAAFKRANDALAAEAEKLAAHLKSDELPAADDTSHVLGEARFARLLKVQEGLDTPLDELLAMGEADLKKNREAYEALLKKVKPKKPKASELLDVARRLVGESRRFLIDKKIVTIPSDDEARVEESPPFMRWNAAFLSGTGPFDAKVEGIYYITLPDPNWPKKEQLGYVMSYGTLLATTVHEVFPGHFLHGLWIRRAPTRTQKLAGSYSFVEGWAHYTEQLMIDEGFKADDPESRLGQLNDALLRNCRFVASFGMHARGMTLAAAEERFRKDCHQERATAHEQAVRGTFDPGYFAYTLGKLQILELRAEAQKRLGARFSLQRFHDALLAHGLPPVRLIRERVLHDLESGG